MLRLRPSRRSGLMSLVLVRGIPTRQLVTQTWNDTKKRILFVFLKTLRRRNKRDENNVVEWRVLGARIGLGWRELVGGNGILGRRRDGLNGVGREGLRRVGRVVGRVLLDGNLRRGRKLYRRGV